MAQLANTMLCAELLINNGDALENKLAEIEKSSGIPFFSTRKDLKGRAEEYLQAGEFLKEIAYRAFSKQIATSESCEAALKIAREKWHHFRSAKDALVGQINSQLAKIG